MYRNMICREALEPAPARRANERGAALVEYAILILLIAAVCILGVTLLGTSTNDIYRSAASSVAG